MSFGPAHFDAPIWLALAPVLWVLSWLIARRSLTGLGDITRRTSLAIRWLVILLIAGALAKPHWKQEAEDLSVILVADRSRSMPPHATELLSRFLVEASDTALPGDRLGVVTVAHHAGAQAIPSQQRTPGAAMQESPVEDWNVGATDATDLAAGLRLAMSIKPEDTAGRLLLFSDGNETTGSLLAAAAAAKSAGLPIDVLLMPYRFDREVIFESLVAPSTARKGQTANLRFVLHATRPAKGTLSLLSSGRVVDLNPDAPGDGIPVDLDAGTNVITLPLTLSESGPLMFEAVFEPQSEAHDTILQNNRALAVTFVSGEGKGLLFTDSPEAAAPLIRALRESRLEVDVRSPSEGFQSLVELQGYDVIMLQDVPSAAFSLRQQRELRAFVHDSGGGLVMIGGPNSFGAGGWIGTPVEEALPLLMDPPQKRQLPRGALAIVIDRSGSMQSGVAGTTGTQQQVAAEAAILAIKALSRLDLVTVIAFDTQSHVAVPLQEVGDRKSIESRIRSIWPGGGTDMFPAIVIAFEQLKEAKAGARHIIALTDGQTGGDRSAGMRFARALKDAGITLSTISIGDYANDPLLRDLAIAGGGAFYSVAGINIATQLPQIFVREAIMVRRSLISEGEPFSPTIVNAAAETMRGISAALPPIEGYVITSDREGLSLVTIRGPQDDPICAQWQYGIGRSVAFTSDSASRWSSAWVSWAQFRSFWDQHVRWAMRPTGSAELSVVTTSEGSRTHVVVTALDADGASLNFARFDGRVTAPDLTSSAIQLHQTGPGRYEGDFESDMPGSFLINLRYQSTTAETGNQRANVDRGSIQAAVTRPFADEFRAINDNTPLLRQVADLTGGRVLNIASGADAGLFDRAGLAMPFALKPIWLAVTLIAIACFLLDVGVRRVRVDLFAISAAVRKAFMERARQRKAGVESLRTAREKARERISEQTTQPAPATASQSTRKFEAGAEHLAQKNQSPIEPLVSASVGPVTDSRRPPVHGQQQAPEEDGMSRLLRAKRRARGDIDQDKPAS